jgi:hypothetical protein
MLYDSELARRTNGRTELRPSGLRVSWELSDLTTTDGHVAAGAFSCTAKGLATPTEQKMLEEAFLSARSSISAVDVSKYFAGAVQSTAREFARTHDAQSLLNESGRQSLTSLLMDAAKAVAFGCGLEMLPPVQLDLDCPTLRRQQTQQRRTAETSEQLRRSGELFKQFESIRAAAPELSPGQVLQRIGIADQADLLRSLLQASAGKTAPARLWAVAGPSLIFIGSDESPSPHLIPLPDGLGPLRSVRAGASGNLLVGCRGGVMNVNPASPESAMLYHDPQVTSLLGFNNAVIAGGRIWATHGEAGLIAWALEQPDQPQITIRPRDIGAANFAPRNLAVLDSSRLIISSGDRLFIVNPDGHLQPLDEPGGNEIVAISPRQDQVLTVHEDGSTCIRDRGNLAQISRQRRAGRITAAALLPWMEDVRLLLATEDGPILCVGVDDELTTQYASPYRAPRIVAGIAQTVAAVTSDRQRLILWNAWDGRKPRAELHLANLARHRIADIAFA